MRTPTEGRSPGRTGRTVRPAGRRRPDNSETRIYSAALRQTGMDERHAMAEALAQADELLGELADAGRFVKSVTARDREADRLRLALALLRARRWGFEDGAALHAWWRDSTDPPSHTAGRLHDDHKPGNG